LDVISVEIEFIVFGLTLWAIQAARSSEEFDCRIARW
jgi:hypothetical protein